MNRPGNVIKNKIWYEIKMSISFFYLLSNLWIMVIIIFDINKDEPQFDNLLKAWDKLIFKN